MLMEINLASTVTNIRLPAEPFQLDVRAYLQRLNYHGPFALTVETLWALYETHCQVIPYENVDLCLGRPLELNEAALFNKIVRQWRGGISCELNGLFAALLRALGFPVVLLAAQRVDDTGQPRNEFLHSMLLVEVERRRWLLDVGAWDTPGVFLTLDDPTPTPWSPSLRATQTGPLWTVWKNIQGDHWRERYLLRLKERPLSSFASQHSREPVLQDAHFLERLICSLETPTGRIVLRRGRLTVTTHNELREQKTVTSSNWRAILRTYFWIEPPE